MPKRKFCPGAFKSFFNRSSQTRKHSLQVLTHFAMVSIVTLLLGILVSSLIAGTSLAYPIPGDPGSWNNAAVTPTVTVTTMGDSKAAAYQELMNGGTAPSGLPVLLDAFFQHQDANLNVNDDKWLLAESYAADHQKTTMVLIGKEAFALIESTNINWNANQNMRERYIRLHGLSIAYALTISNGAGLENKTSAQIDEYVKSLTTESEHILQDETSAVNGCSFTPETLVTTVYGKQPIGILHMGEPVLAYNVQTHRMELQPILHVWVHKDDDLVDLTLAAPHQTSHSQSGKPTQELIHTNKKHPFLTKEKGFLPAGEITPGMHVVEANGYVGEITGWKLVPGVMTMYNLEVAQDHTFTVGVGQWVVHNCGGSPLSVPSQVDAQNAQQILAELEQSNRGMYHPPAASAVWETDRGPVLVHSGSENIIPENTVYGNCAERQCIGITGKIGATPLQDPGGFSQMYEYQVNGQTPCDQCQNAFKDASTKWGPIRVWGGYSGNVLQYTDFVAGEMYGPFPTP